MKSLATYSSIFVLLSFVLGAVYPSESFGQSITNGYVCAPKNIGGEDTRRYFRQQDGVAVNIAPNAAFPVVCPVVIDIENQSHNIIMRLANAGTSTQRYACSMEEYDRNFALVRSIGKSVNISPATSNSLDWQNISLLAPSNFLSIRCILPPRSAIGLVAWF